MPTPVRQRNYSERQPVTFALVSGEGFSVLSGTFVFGKKRACEEALRVLGGVVADTVTLSTDYLIVGTLGDRAWAYGFFGTKIEKARQQLEGGHPIAIISEEHWLNEMERVMRLPATTSRLKS
jgi:NAD-dependent DNA ligase